MGTSSRSGSLPAVPTLAPGSVDGTSARARLVERAQAGDQAAFEALLQRWLVPAFRIGLAILGEESDARDATQDAFLAAWRQLPRLRDPERFDAWLNRILVNSCHGIRRDRRRTAVREIPVSGLGEQDEPTGDRRETVDELASLDVIERAFSQLSMPDRAILVLHHLECRSLAEIAALLDIPMGTAKSRLFNARRSLERALEAEQR